MRIIYVSNSRIPTEKAYGVSIVKTCSALAKKGVEVLLLAPRVKNNTKEDIFSYYGVQKNFSIRYIPTFDAVTLGWRYGFLVNQISFGIAVFFLYAWNRKSVVITRDEIAGFLLGLIGIRAYYDMHGFPERLLWIWRIMLWPVSGIITTNDWKIEQCYTRLGIPKKRMTVVRNGFDPELFVVEKSREVLRKQLNLPNDKPIVLYTGHLYDWKGVFVLAEAAQKMPQVNFIFVGGTYYHRADFEKRYSNISNIILVGQRPYQEIPLYLKAADVLALPNSTISLGDPRFLVYTSHDTSPIKLFEYMASGVPIVASDLPSLQEVLNKKNAVLVKPDSPEDLKRGIELILNDKVLASTISKMALGDVKEYTWEKRAEKVLMFINEPTQNFFKVLWSGDIAPENIITNIKTNSLVRTDVSEKWMEKEWNNFLREGLSALPDDTKSSRYRFCDFREDGINITITLDPCVSYRDFIGGRSATFFETFGVEYSPQPLSVSVLVTTPDTDHPMIMLSVRRNVDYKSGGYHASIGGFVDIHKENNPVSALYREVKEECGIERHELKNVRCVSLVYNPRVFHYDMVFTATVRIDSKEIQKRMKDDENESLFFIPATRQSIEGLIKKTSHAIVSTAMVGLLLVGKRLPAQDGEREQPEEWHGRMLAVLAKESENYDSPQIRADLEARDIARFRKIIKSA